MLKAVVVKEWAEVKRNGLKVEDWSWTVTFYKDGQRVDEHYYNTEEVANAAAAAFEAGHWTVSEWGGVDIAA